MTMIDTCNPLKNTIAITKLYKRLQQTHYSKKARRYLRTKGLQPRNGNMAFISKNYPGYHDKKLIEKCGKHALLHPLSDNGYALWHENCIVFPMRNKQGNISSLFGQSISDKKQHQSQYLSNMGGLYPGYPSPHSNILLLAPNIPEAALLLEHKNAGREYNVLALCSTNGLTPEHKEAILNWSLELASGREGEHMVTSTQIWIILAFDPKAASIPALQQAPDQLRALLKDACIIVDCCSGVSNSTVQINKALQGK